MDNTTKIIGFLKRNPNIAYTSNLISKNTGINPISVRRILRKQLSKTGRLKVIKSRKKVKGLKPYIPFYHVKKEQEIVEYRWK